MRHVIALATVALLGAALPFTLAAQTDSVAQPLFPGTRVRVSSVARLKPVTGVVLTSTRDSLLVRAEPAGDTATFAVAQLSRLEVSAGSRTHRLRGAALGFGSGAVLGALVGVATYTKPDCRDFCLDFGPGFDAAAGAVFLGAVGSVAGLLIGSRSSESWVSVAGGSAPAVRVGIGPARGRHTMAVTASLRF